MTAVNSKGLVFVISGPSGSGKGTVVELLRQIYPNAGVSVSATSRKPREGEVEGVSYYYKTREEFERLIENGEVLEHTEYSGNYYGTLKSEAKRILESGRDLILEIEIDGGGQVKRLLGDECVAVMLMAPSAAEQERRLRGRGTESDEVIARRIERTRAEIEEAQHYDYVVVNETDGTMACAERILAIIEAEHSRSGRMKAFVDGYFTDGTSDESEKK